MNAKTPGESSFAFGVVILAAGASVRMGRPKLLLPWGDRSIAGHLIRLWQGLGATQIAMVCRAGDTAMTAELDRLGVAPAERIINPEPERGMFSSIVCAANWDGWQPGLSAWALVLGDQPHLRREMLSELIEAQRAHPDAICQPAHEGCRKHPVMLPREVFLELRNSSAATLKTFLDGKPRTFFESRTNDGGLNLDLDRPEDYDKAITLYLSVA